MIVQKKIKLDIAILECNFCYVDESKSCNF